MEAPERTEEPIPAPGGVRQVADVRRLRIVRILVGMDAICLPDDASGLVRDLLLPASLPQRVTARQVTLKDTWARDRFVLSGRKGWWASNLYHTHHEDPDMYLFDAPEVAVNRAGFYQPVPHPAEIADVLGIRRGTREMTPDDLAILHFLVENGVRSLASLTVHLSVAWRVASARQMAANAELEAREIARDYLLKRHRRREVAEVLRERLFFLRHRGLILFHYPRDIIGPLHTADPELLGRFDVDWDGELAKARLAARPLSPRSLDPRVDESMPESISTSRDRPEHRHRPTRDALDPLGDARASQVQVSITGRGMVALAIAAPEAVGQLPSSILHEFDAAAEPGVDHILCELQGARQANWNAPLRLEACRRVWDQLAGRYVIRAHSLRGHSRAVLNPMHEYLCDHVFTALRLESGLVRPEGTPWQGAVRLWTEWPATWLIGMGQPRELATRISPDALFLWRVGRDHHAREVPFLMEVVTPHNGMAQTNRRLQVKLNYLLLRGHTRPLTLATAGEALIRDEKGRPAWGLPRTTEGGSHPLERTPTWLVVLPRAGVPRTDRVRGWRGQATATVVYGALVGQLAWAEQRGRVAPRAEGDPWFAVAYIEDILSQGFTAPIWMVQGRTPAPTREQVNTIDLEGPAGAERLFDADWNAPGMFEAATHDYTGLDPDRAHLILSEFGLAFGKQGRRVKRARLVAVRGSLPETYLGRDLGQTWLDGLEPMPGRAGTASLRTTGAALYDWLRGERARTLNDVAWWLSKPRETRERLLSVYNRPNYRGRAIVSSSDEDELVDTETVHDIDEYKANILAHMRATLRRVLDGKPPRMAQAAETPKEGLAPTGNERAPWPVTGRSNLQRWAIPRGASRKGWGTMPRPRGAVPEGQGAPARKRRRSPTGRRRPRLPDGAAASMQRGRRVRT